MSDITTTSASTLNSFFARVVAAARYALQLHLQTCAIIAESYRRPN
ncbi:hypothetical protein [Paraburkholderia sp.]|jgi:DNA-directed RNA polymerase subunit K/omega